MKLFLSCVSSEFKSYRLKLANHLVATKGGSFEFKVQEDFQQSDPGERVDETVSFSVLFSSRWSFEGRRFRSVSCSQCGDEMTTRELRQTALSGDIGPATGDFLAGGSRPQTNRPRHPPSRPQTKTPTFPAARCRKAHVPERRSRHF
jgi:hypothetical protein